jgi:hypothetical protein
MLQPEKEILIEPLKFWFSKSSSGAVFTHQEAPRYTIKNLTANFVMTDPKIKVINI